MVYYTINTFSTRVKLGIVCLPRCTEYCDGRWALTAIVSQYPYLSTYKFTSGLLGAVVQNMPFLVAWPWPGQLYLAFIQGFCTAGRHCIWPKLWPNGGQTCWLTWPCVLCSCACLCTGPRYRVYLHTCETKLWVATATMSGQWGDQALGARRSGVAQHCAS